MSINESGAFAFITQEKYFNKRAIFRTSLRAWFYLEEWKSFIDWILYVLFEIDFWKSFPTLKKLFESIHERKIKEDLYLDELEEWYTILLQIWNSDNTNLKNEFYNLVKSMEETLPQEDDKGFKILRIITKQNWVDFAKYIPWIHWIPESTKVKLLLGWVKAIEGDDIKTLWEELNDNIKIIKERVNRKLNIDAITETWVILGDNISLVSRTDWPASWLVYLVKDWKVIWYEK